MPPEASSRSRTYFPKIWGNTRRLHGTALLVASLASACTTVPGDEELRAIRVHWLPGCGPSADAPEAAVDLTALGDFDPSEDTREVVHEFDESDGLRVPAATRTVVLDVTTGVDAWRGLGTMDAGGDFDASLWPTNDACPLLDAGDSGPAGGVGAAVGFSAEAAIVLVAGGEGTSAAATAALVVELGTGSIALVDSTEGLRARRGGATVTPFGPGQLAVVGGRDLGGRPVDSADVFDSRARRFLPQLVQLEQPRAHHAAVQLVSGETLLVGGVGADGSLFRTLEAISPESRQYRISGLTDLREGRLDPVALRLSDGRILVAGGTDEVGAPSGRLEWLSSDASRLEHESTALVEAAATTAGRAFVAMPGASALAVGGCVRRTPDETERAACARSCGEGGGCPSRDVAWITRDGRVDVLPGALDVDAARPLLAAGEGGRPWLVGETAGGVRVFRRFDPWRARFVTPELAPPAPVDPGATLIAPDAGLLIWLTREDGAPALRGFRHGVRGPFVQPVLPFLLDGTDGVALDRAPGIDAEHDAETGEVLLNAAGASLVVTDAMYADVDVLIDVTAGPPPVVHLGERGYGNAGCPWPATAMRGPYRARLLRRGSDVDLALGGALRKCPGPLGRAALWLERAGAPVRLRSIAVSRGDAR